jgi:RimJ/RimL family protein N-acetyltransferase
LESADIVQAPVLHTERLTLRSFRLDDFVHSAAMWADPVVTRYIGGVPSNEQQSWTRVLRYVGHWALLGFGYWAVEETANGAFLGEVGFADFRRVIEPPIRDTPELGWVVESRFHGQGFATEAVRAAVAWGDAHLRKKRTVCIIDPENVASSRVAQKCGFRELVRTTYLGEPTIMYERIAP